MPSMSSAGILYRRVMMFHHSKPFEPFAVIRFDIH